MIVQDVINTARYSELASTSIKDNDEAILLFLNAGLIELYKRFPIYTKEHIIELVEGTTIYPLPTDYMYTIAAYEEVPLISAGLVAEIPINDEYSDRSIFIPNHKEVQIPLVANDSYISLIYVPKPKNYTLLDVAEDLELPETLIECLFHYMGYKAHLGIRSDGQSENNAHFIRFERSCDKARELGVAHPIDSLRMAERTYNRGFA